MCVFRKTQHSFTRYPCTAQIHKLKFKSEYYLRKQQLCQKCKHRQPHFDFLNTDSKKISTWVSLLKRNDLLAKLCFSCNLSIGCLPKFDFSCVSGFFLAGFLFENSFFSKSRLCTRPLFSCFLTNLDQLAGQPIL